MSDSGWIGVDLDGTLAHYESGDFSQFRLGAPVPAMVERVRRWLGEGWEVRIFTARVSCPERDRGLVVECIEAWCVAHIGRRLPVTNVKDYAMVELWDDRAVQVEPNTGRPIGQSTRGLT